MSKAGLYWNTVRHLRPQQVGGRLYHRGVWGILKRKYPFFLARRYAAKAAEVEAAADGLAPPDCLIEPPVLGGEEDGRLVEAADDILEGRFCLLNETVDMGRSVDWHPDRSRLWVYHLQYCDFVLDLAAAYRVTGDAAYAGRIVELVDQWIAAHAACTGPGWEPYTLSVRLPNWLLADAVLRRVDPGAALGTAFWRSVAQQAACLYRHLEYDILGNHLIKNCRALVFAGTACRGGEADKWLARGLAVWQGQLDEQLLEDGGHFERSPMYHMIVLRDSLETGLLARRRQGAVPEKVLAVLGRAMDFFEGTLLDGDIPLFNDAVLGAVRPSVLRWLAAALLPDRPPAEGTKAYKASGYYVLRAADASLVVDCGPPCPPYLPPHAHADTLSFEMAVGGRRMIVDSGVDRYEAGAWRAYFRSTRAHNTVVVDGTEQSQAWGSFRMGRRAQPRGARLEASPTGPYFYGSHTGYAHMGIVHHRHILLLSGGVWLVLDCIAGKGRHRVEDFLHFHPGVECAERSGEGAVLRRDGVGVQLRWLDAADVRVCRGETQPIQGWYAPAFGRRAESLVFHRARSGPLPLWSGYLIRTAGSGEARVAWPSEQRLELSMAEGEYGIDLRPQRIDTVRTGTQPL